jgi:hypothetical protein
MRLTRWIWSGPAIFLLHDVEEVLTIAPWLRAHRAELPAALQPLLGVTTGRFALAVLLLLAGFVAAAAHGARRAGHGRRSVVFLLAAGALVGNGLTHLAQAVFFRAYTPGLVTALLLVLPYGYGLGARLEASGLASRRVWAGAVAAGAVLQAPLVALTLLAVQ